MAHDEYIGLDSETEDDGIVNATLNPMDVKDVHWIYWFDDEIAEVRLSAIRAVRPLGKTCIRCCTKRPSSVGHEVKSRLFLTPSVTVLVGHSWDQLGR